MKASGCDLAELGARMRAAREALNLSQARLAEENGYSVRTYQKNEGGVNEAGICLAAAFTRAGINANWLLTGEGPMLLDDFGAAAPTELDPARLQLAIATVEEGLATNGRVMAPDKKAELVLAVYDIYQEPGATRERVLKLVKSAA